MSPGAPFGEVVNAGVHGTRAFCSQHWVAGPLDPREIGEFDDLQPLALLGASQQRPLAKGPPHQSAQMAIVAVQSQDAFADDTPNNLADYLDCGVQTGEEELMETARTSRLEDLKE